MNPNRIQWTTQSVALAQKSFQTLFLASAEGKNPRARVDICLDMVAMREDRSDSRYSDGDALTFFAVVEALMIDGGRGVLSLSEIRRITDMARMILKIHKIPEYDSDLSFMHAMLFTALSKASDVCRTYRKAILESDIAGRARSEGGTQSEADDCFCNGMRLLRLGHTRVASIALKSAATLFRQVVDPRWEDALVLYVRSLRLAQEFEDAIQLIEDHIDLSCRQEIIHALSWEKICLQAQQQGGPGLLATATGRRRSYRRFMELATFQLWALASDPIRWERVLSKTRTFREMPLTDMVRAQERSFLIDAIEALERCRSDGLVHERASQLGHLVDRLDRFPTVELKCLFMVAAARWLLEMKIFTTAEILLVEYREISLRMTMGRSSDVFNVGGAVSSAQIAIAQKYEAIPCDQMTFSRVS